MVSVLAVIPVHAIGEDATGAEGFSGVAWGREDVVGFPVRSWELTSVKR